MKISIIISNYNKAKFLKKCLDSCISQNFKSFEIILVDDNSTDDSRIILKKYKKKIKLLEINKNFKNFTPARKQFYALKKGFKASKGKIICLLDSDDFFFKKKLKNINYIFEKKKINFLINNFVGYKSENQKFYFKEKKKFYLGSIWPNNFQTSALSFERDFFAKFLKITKNDNSNYLEIDAKLVIFAHFYYNSLHRTNLFLSYWRLNSVELSTITKKFTIKWFIKRKEAFEYVKFIMKKKDKKFIPSLDYYITTIINKIISFL